MDDIIKQCKPKVTPLYIEYKQLQPIGIAECAYVDDVAVLAGSENCNATKLKKCIK